MTSISPQTTLGAPSTTSGSAVLDSAHVGDIVGAFGRIRMDAAGPGRSWWQRLRMLMVITGPGLIVMVGDNDAGGVATYTQAGQNYGMKLLWTLALLIPVLYVNQEMVLRLGAVTRVGHARLIFERFGKFWGAFSVGDLLILNALTIVTEFIGVSLALGFLGCPKAVAIPAAAVLLFAVIAGGSFRRWEQLMFVLIAVNIVIFPLALSVRPAIGASMHGLIPSLPGGQGSAVLLLIMAIVGTTVAPWQLFFQQSNVVDKRITPRFIGYERIDTTLGAFVVVIGGAALMMTGDWAARATHSRGNFVDAGVLAHLLGQHSSALGSVFAIVLLDASIIGAAAVTLASSYAFGDVFGLKHSLHRGFADAKPFYLSYTVMVVVAAAIVLIPSAPLGLITTGVQALAGLLLPSATVFLLLLCNDREVLGPWVNRPWLNVVAGFIVSVLLLLSGILMATTVFPDLNIVSIATGLSVSFVLFAVTTFGVLWWTGRWRPKAPVLEQLSRELARADRDTWRMPPLALLEPVKWSAGTRV